MDGLIADFSGDLIAKGINLGEGFIENDKIHTIFCSKLRDVASWWTFVRHAFLICLLLLIVYVIFNLYTTRDEHPIKQRAPYVALFHLVITFLYISMLYILEWNSLKSWDAKTYSEVPLLRKLIQKLVVAFRISFATVYVLRTAVIWCQWKCHRKSGALVKWFANERNAILAYIGVIILNFPGFIFLGFDGGGLFYPSLNWFCPERKSNYIFVNMGVFNMIEIVLLSGCFYIIRNFPDNFGVKKEALWIGATCFLCTLFSNILNPFKLGDNSHECKDNFPPYFIPQFFFEFLRTLSLTLTIWIMNQPKPLLPPTPTRLLTNFKVFTSNSLCVKAFAAFLPTLKCNRVTDEFEEFMRGQIEECQVALLSRGSSETGIPTALNNAFLEYQKTYSFEFIKQRLEEYETVFHLRFKMVVY